MGKKLIIDVDTGSDDALAIMLALHQPDIDVFAITCVSGNTSIDNVCENTLRVIDVCSKSNIPVYKGAEKPILSQIQYDSRYGKDGLGDCDWSDPVDTSRIQPEHAVIALLRLVNQCPGEITLVILGPMTNIALAIRLDPGFADKLKEVFVMGGNIEGKGRVTPAAEHNFFCDPEAAHIVLHDMKFITLLPYEICLRTVINWEVCDKFSNMETTKSAFLKKIFEKCNTKYREHDPGFRPCDLFVMVAVVDNSVVVETEDVYGDIELCGRLTLGQMVVDHRGRMDMASNIRIIKKFNMDKLTDLTFNMLK